MVGTLAPSFMEASVRVVALPTLQNRNDEHPYSRDGNPPE
jgi:hypothetical protein